jgi:S1/P1 Nuclease
MWEITMRIPAAFFLFILFGLTLHAVPALAWGEFGHLTVCDLAYRNLTHKTHEELKKLFQIATGGITVPGRDGIELRHYTSFNVGCLEEDERPRKHPEDHFINVARDTAAISGASCPGGTTCILSGIQRDLAVLKDGAATNEARVFALMAVGHWIGDIHQPLHISFADDRGGNSIDAKLQGKCGTSKYRVKEMHGLWDNCLLEAGMFERVRKRADFKPTWGRRTITYRAVDTLQTNTTLTEEKAFAGIDPWRWADESFQITIAPAVNYCTKVGNVCQYSAAVPTLPAGGPKRQQAIDQAYLAAFDRVAEDRVKRAGFRLAHLINLALDPAYTVPVQNSTQRP